MNPLFSFARMNELHNVPTTTNTMWRTFYSQSMIFNVKVSLRWLTLFTASLWMTNLLLDLVNSCPDELNFVPCLVAFQLHRKEVGPAQTSCKKELYHKSTTRYYPLYKYSFLVQCRIREERIMGFSHNR